MPRQYPPLRTAPDRPSASPPSQHEIHPAILGYAAIGAALGATAGLPWALAGLALGGLLGAARDKNLSQGATMRGAR